MEEQKKQIPVFYVNIASASSSVYDFSLLLGNKKDDTNQFTEDDVELKLIMSPQHAKAFVNVLKEQIQIYERLYGEINLKADPEFLKKLQQGNSGEGWGNNEDKCNRL